MSSYSDPASGVFVITPSDTENFVKTTRSIFVGGGGNLSVLAADGSTAVLAGVPAGSVLPIAVRRVNASGTSATGLVGLL